MSTPAVSLIDVASYLPGEPVPARVLLSSSPEPTSCGTTSCSARPKYRHHVAEDETAST